MTHKKKDLPEDLSRYDPAVTGHSHQYAETRQGNTLILDPGSCGPCRFYQKITMAIVNMENKRIETEKIEISHPANTRKAGPADIRSQIEIVIRKIEKGRGKNDIAPKYGIDPETAEMIARLHLTHPGVAADGIMRKMGL